MRLLFLSLAFICNIECIASCIGDSIFQTEYEQTIDFVKTCFLGNMKKYGDSVSVKELQDKISYLEVITNIKAINFDFEHLFFNKKSDIKKSIRSWENWYKKNKCNFTKSEADNLILQNQKRIDEEIKRRLYPSTEM